MIEDIEWFEANEYNVPTSDYRYAGKYIRVLADDEYGFVREAFYDSADNQFYTLAFNSILGIENAYVVPLLASRWAYLPKSRNTFDI